MTEPKKDRLPQRTYQSKKDQDTYCVLLTPILM
jgi:hypothetical protein